MSFPRAEVEQRSADRTDLWEERGGVSWGFLVVNALRARELYAVRRTRPGAGPLQPGTWAEQHTMMALCAYMLAMHATEYGVWAFCFCQPGR